MRLSTERWDPLLMIKRSPDVCAPRRDLRLPDFVGASGDTARILDALAVLIIGAGSIGLAAIEHLARLQIGAIGVVDPADLKDESLLTHPIGRDALGRRKARYAAKRARSISPVSRIGYHAGRAQDLPLSTFARTDVIILASDNLEAERDVGARAMTLGIPLVQGSVHGESLTAQVRFFGCATPDSACPACSFSAREWRDLEASVAYSCAGAGAGPATVGVAPAKLPTRSPSSLCALAASLVVHQVLRHILRLGKPVEDTVLTYCGYGREHAPSPLRRREGCPLAHERFERVHVARPVATHSLREIAYMVGLDAERLGRDISFSIGDRSFVEQATCCGRAREVRRFATAGDSAGACPQCGGGLCAEPFYARRSVGADEVDLARPLSHLGASGAPEVLVRCGARAILVL